MNPRKRLLIISYYWPPAGGAGVQRPLKFAHYLPDFGWQPIIFTAKDAHYPMEDQSLVAQVPKDLEVLNCPIWEPYNAYRKLLGYKKEEKVQAGFIEEEKKNSKLQSLAVWVRGNLFIPDARKFWVGPAVKSLLRYLEEQPVDAIFSTGPPHTVHLIAKAIKLKTGIPWVADFRDPWTNIDFYNQLKLSKRADAKHHQLEKQVLQTADAVTTVSWTWAEELAEIRGSKVEVVTNGFDDADFGFNRTALDQRFSIAHIGTVTKDRNPKALWTVLAKLCQENKQFNEQLQIRFVGKTDYSIFASIEQAGLSRHLQKIDHMPYTEAIRVAAQSQLLLLLVNDAPNSQGRIPIKVYEYLPCQRPVLGIGHSKGDAAKIISEMKAGEVFDFEQEEEIKHFLQRSFKQFQQGKLQLPARDYQKYSRRNTSKELAKVLDQLGH